MTSFLQYVADNSSLLIEYTLQHLRIGMLAVAIGIVIGLPLGLLIAKLPFAQKPVLGLSSVMQAVPSLALMGFFIPFIGIGDKTAIVIIGLYALLPIIRNTYTGLTNIDQSMMEAARGIGMTETQILFRVQLPLALPVIMAGIRVAAVNSIGSATIAAFIGGGGLGKQIYAGIQIINVNMILSGAIPACLLALLIDFIFSLIEKAVVPISLQLSGAAISTESLKKMKTHRRNVLAVALSALVVLTGSIVYDSIDWAGMSGRTVTIGTTEYIEERIVSQLYAQLIEDRTDLTVELNNAMGSSLVLWEALRNDEIDIVPAYTGTWYGTVLELPLYPGMTEDDTYNNVAEALRDYGITAAGQLGPNNQYVFAVKPELAEQYGLEKVSDLAPYASNWIVGCSQSYYARENDGLFPTCEEYGMSFKEALTFGAAPMYLALENGDVDVIVTYRTDGLLQRYDLVLLEDDRNFIPPYVLFAMINDEALARHPELLEACMELDHAVTDAEMQEMNLRGAEAGEEPYDIAREFLLEKGLISGE